MVKRKLHNKFQSNSDFFDDIIESFAIKGKDYGAQKRNSLKLFELNGVVYNVKSFKKPNLVNKIAYRFFRKSKARRSYENALELLKNDIGTPNPVGYYEYASWFFFGKSFYISEQLECDLTYRDLVTNIEYPNREKILKAFTRFTYDLHNKGVNFLDHSPGNTLIKENLDKTYSFYLVDLNRMRFQKMNFEERMNNFSRLTKDKEMVKVMSYEYAEIYNTDKERVFTSMWKHIQKFYSKHEFRQRIKRFIKLKK